MPDNPALLATYSTNSCVAGSDRQSFGRFVSSAAAARHMSVRQRKSTSAKMVAWHLGVSTIRSSMRKVANELRCR
jgi:hypothetical protein